MNDDSKLKKRTVRWESSDDSNDEVKWTGYDKENKHLHTKSSKASTEDPLKAWKRRTDGARSQIRELLDGVVEAKEGGFMFLARDRLEVARASLELALNSRKEEEEKPKMPKGSGRTGDELQRIGERGSDKAKHEEEDVRELVRRFDTLERDLTGKGLVQPEDDRGSVYKAGQAEEERTQQASSKAFVDLGEEAVKINQADEKEDQKVNQADEKEDQNLTNSEMKQDARVHDDKNEMERANRSSSSIRQREENEQTHTLPKLRILPTTSSTVFEDLVEISSTMMQHNNPVWSIPRRVIILIQRNKSGLIVLLLPPSL
eukprot:747773-Hanusia_phi.AAC.8